MLLANALEVEQPHEHCAALYTPRHHREVIATVPYHGTPGLTQHCRRPADKRVSASAGTAGRLHGGEISLPVHTCIRPSPHVTAARAEVSCSFVNVAGTIGRAHVRLPRAIAQPFLSPRRPAYLRSPSTRGVSPSEAPQWCPSSPSASRSTIDQCVQWVPPCRGRRMFGVGLAGQEGWRLLEGTWWGGARR